MPRARIELATRLHFANKLMIGRYECTTNFQKKSISLRIENCQKEENVGTTYFG